MGTVERQPSTSRREDIVRPAPDAPGRPRRRRPRLLRERSAIKRHIIGCTLFFLSPAVVFAQATEPIVAPPASAAAAGGPATLHPTHRLGKFGESCVADLLRASGFEVHDANLNDRGIDLLAVRRDARGVLNEVRPVEVKTLSHRVDFRLDMTGDGRQLSSRWLDTRLAKLARDHPDPALRRLATEITAFKAAHPERVHPQLHGLSIGDDVYRVSRVDPRTAAVGELVSEGRVTRHLEGLARSEVNPGMRKAAIRHLQQFDQIRAGTKIPGASASTIAKLPTTAAKGVKAAAARPSLLTRAIPVAGKVLAVGGVMVEVATRGDRAYQVERRFRDGEISDRDRFINHAKNGAGMAGGWGGAMALGSLGASWGSAAGPVGAFLGAAGGGMVGYVGGEKLAEGAVEICSEELYIGIDAARTATDWAGKQLESMVVYVGGDKLAEGAVGIGSYVMDGGIDAARTATSWAGKQLESGAGAVGAGAEYASTRIGFMWDAARGHIGW